MSSRGRLAIVTAAMVGLFLASASAALACVCVEATMGARLDQSDAAVVGRIVAEGRTAVRGVELRLLTVEVDQRVKGEVERTLAVRSPFRTDCDVVIPKDEQTGLLLTRTADGAWFATACSLADAGELVAAGGEPRGGAIKVAVGLVILALVLVWAFTRLRRGTRPQLPGAPRA